MEIMQLGDHTICPKLLKPDSIVLDIGANYGAFTHDVVEQFHCKVYAVEASPSVFCEIGLNDRIKKFNLAICGTSGPVTLNISSDSEATSLKQLRDSEYVGTVVIQGMTLHDFLKSESIPRVNLLKMDIEGAEIEVFNSCPDNVLAAIDQITIEFHEWAGVCSEAEVKNIVQRLGMLGFFVFKQTRTNFRDVLFVNKRHISKTNYVFTQLGLWVPRIIRYVGRKMTGPKRGIEHRRRATGRSDCLRSASSL
jgi:FkbM family methyltransferase